MSYPFPGDSPVVVARRVANAYRSRLALADPAACEQLDALCQRWGLAWAVPRPVTVDMDGMLTGAQAAELAGVGVATVRQWRIRGRLTGQHDGRRWWYRARDVYELSGTVRRRGRSVTDTLGDSGRGVPA